MHHWIWNISLFKTVTAYHLFAYNELGGNKGYLYTNLIKLSERFTTL